MIDAFAEVLVGTPAFHALMANSALIAVGVLFGQMIIAPPAAWVLARFPFPGKKAVTSSYLLLLILPFQATLLPSYLILDAFNLIDTLWAIVLPGAFNAFPVIIMTVAFGAIPESLLESARLDGANEGSVFLHIGLPLAAPGVFAALLLGFFEYWNAVEQPLAFLQSQELWPIALFSPTTAGATAVMGAAAVLASIPGLLLFIWGLPYLEEGLGRLGHVRKSR